MIQNRIAQFSKISFEQFERDWTFGTPCPYGELRLPKRATLGSAGYDFFSPLDFSLAPGEFITIPTGIRVRIEDGWVLSFSPVPDRASDTACSYTTALA